MTGFSQTFVGKELEKVEEFFDKEYALALQILEPSIEALRGVIKKEGPTVIKSIVAAMAVAAESALTTGLGKPDAAKAALAAIIVAGENVAATALEKLGTDAAHAVATAAVSTQVSA